MDKFLVIRQEWEESERGWGCRPDGYSLHLDKEDRDTFVKNYWDSMPKECPDEYSRPCGEAVATPVDKEVYDLIRAKYKEYGVRYY
jgi:hypothetical protein